MNNQQAAPYFSANKAPRRLYAHLVEKGLIEHDAAQEPALEVLETLYNQLLKKEDTRFWPFGGKKHRQVQSVYLWGGVGRGKSMLMDLFFDALPGKISRRRVHFHRFMLDVHKQLHKLRKQGGDDHMEQLIEQIAKAQRVLCFDELQATDVADASLITRIFEGLMEHNVIVVATSNRPPKELYQGEVQKERFEQLTALIYSHFNVLELLGATDHRTQQVQSLESTYCLPLGVESDMFIQDTIAHLSPSNHQEESVLEVSGRELKLKSYGEKIALSSFDELCGKALGAADYLAIADRFDVLILADIPLLSPENRNEAKRFVTLIDALYEHKVRLIATAAANPDDLYISGHGSFEFERTASRLMEMQSAGYLASN